MCVPTLLGVSIQWEMTAYTVTENSGTVQLVLIKEGSTDINASVAIMTVEGDGAGEADEA